MPTRKSSTPLQRGLACLCCRKRKLKCDGTRPVCHQCTKMNRADQCEYDDKKQKSRTQKLREKLLMLEERIRELESEPGVPSSSLEYLQLPNFSPSPEPNSLLQPTLDPLDLSSLTGSSGSSLSFSRPDSRAWAESSSAGSSSSSLGGPSPSMSHLKPADFGGSYQGSDEFLSSFTHGFEMSPFPNAFSGTNMYMPVWNRQDPLPIETHRILVDIFSAHRHQCYFECDLTRFDPMSSSTFCIDGPHPALLNAIYLLACHYSRNPAFTELEGTFFAQLRHEINVALDKSDRLVDLVQASSLLAVYHYSKGQNLEGYCQSFSATRLAIGLGLHQIRLPSSGYPQEAVCLQSETTPIPVSPPRDEAQLLERINVFWQAFVVDRCWSVTNGLPVALTDGECRMSSIQTPWPVPSVVGQTHEPPSTENTIRRLYQYPYSALNSEKYYLPALKAQASALFERSFRFQKASNKPDSYWADYNETRTAVKYFIGNLPYFNGLETWRTQAPYVDVELFAVLTMVHVSLVHLDTEVTRSDTSASCNYILALIRQLTDWDYEFLDPILSSCWMSVARHLINSLAVASNDIDNNNLVEAYTFNILEQQLIVVLNAMKGLGCYFPSAVEHTRKIEQEYQATLQARAIPSFS